MDMNEHNFDHDLGGRCYSKWAHNVKNITEY